MRPRWSEILVLSRWEVRSALRDRTIVVNTIVLPLVLYPLLLWVAFNGIAFVRGQTDTLVSRVALIPEEAVLALGESLTRDERFTIVPTPAHVAAAEEQVRLGELDALVEIEAARGRAPYDVPMRIVFDASRERSSLARARLDEVTRDIRRSQLRGLALARGVGPAAWAQFVVASQDAASAREVSAFLLGLMLPLFFVVMVALGCLHPAIDSTAGERERGTWETLMTTSARRSNIVFAKYLSVTMLGGLAGALNVLAMLLTIRGVMAPLAGRTAGTLDVHLSWSAVPVMMVSAALLAGLLAAGMMLLAAFARTFREGQSMVMPFYVATTLPVTFLSTPGLELTMATALVPVVNIALVVREAIVGTMKPVEMVTAAVATLVVIFSLLRLAALVLATESVVVGSYSGGLLRFVRERLGASRSSRDRDGRENPGARS